MASPPTRTRVFDDEGAPPSAALASGARAFGDLPFDEGRALSFLAKSRSRLLREAARWLTERDDPVDLLFILSRDTADALGPFDTFRYAALLGLTPAPPVRELGLDVLAEPLSDGDRLPPVHHALALAWAKRALPSEDAPYASSVLKALRARKDPNAHPALLASAELALLPLVGEDPSETLGTLARLLDAEDAPAVATTAYEALVLSAAKGALVEAALARMSEGQREDGGLSAQLEHPVVRGLATLRAVCLLRLQESQGA